MINHSSKRSKSVFFLFLAVLCLFSVFLSCAGGGSFASGGLGRARDPVPFMANARTGVLPSGMRYYLLENTRPEGRAFLTLAVNAGSILETEEERGLAHFVEHMAFNGSARFPKSELLNYLRSLGMRFGPEVNARTSFDFTIYDIEVPVETGPDGLRRIPERALAVLDDWTWALTFDPDDFENERLVILEEYRFRMGARERINRQIYPVLFRDSRYAQRLPIGTLEVLENVGVEGLIEFYQRWYRPENMAIVIVGDFEADILEAELERHFPVRNIPAAAGPFNRPIFDLRRPERGNFETLIVTDLELTNPRIDLYWKRSPEPRRQDLSFYRESLADELIDTMIALRFHEDALRSENPYVWAGAGTSNFGFSSRFFLMAAQAKTASVTATLGELLLVSESLIRHGFVQDELDAAKSYLISSLEQMVYEEDRLESSNFISAFTQHFLNGSPVPDVSWELHAVKSLLPGIDLREINRTVRNYFAADDLIIIISAPESERENLPDHGEIAAMFTETRRAGVAPPARNISRGDLLAYLPEPGRIVSESIDAETGALRWGLSNGAEVILRESRNTNNQIAFYALARGGTFSVPEEAAVSAALAADMLSASGLGPHSRPELTRILLDKQVSMSFWTQSFLRGFQGSAAMQDAQTLFEMIYLGFTQPGFDPEAVNALLAQRRSAMANQENDPSFVFRREVTRTIHGNPRYHPIVLADLDRVNLDDAMAFMESGLNPGDYTFVFVGNMNMPVMRSLAESYLASIPPGPALNQWTDIDPLRPPDTAREIYRGIDERSVVDLRWFRPLEFTEEKFAAASALSDYLEIQLNDVIREALGGVYSIGSAVSLSLVPRGELLGIVTFTCDPARVDELIQAILEELQKIARGEIDQNVFDQAIEAMIQGHEDLIQRDIMIAQSYANSVQIFNSPLSRQDRRPFHYRAVSINDVQRVMGELLEGSLIRMVLFPQQ